MGYDIVAVGERRGSNEQVVRAYHLAGARKLHEEKRMRSSNLKIHWQDFYALEGAFHDSCSPPSLLLGNRPMDSDKQLRCRNSGQAYFFPSHSVHQSVEYLTAAFNRDEYA